MKRRLLDLLECPWCGRTFDWESFDTPATPDEVREGALRCGCGRVFPITRGIPRILENAWELFPAFATAHAGRLGAIPRPAAAAQTPVSEAIDRTRDSFGYQWTTFSELSTFHGGCHGGNRQGPDCNAAISRLCGARGLGTGFGPVENAGDDATIVCTPNATVLEGSYAVLSGYDAGCGAYAERAGAACSRAIHLWCRDQGFETGHGPLENTGDLAVVACMGVPH